MTQIAPRIASRSLHGESHSQWRARLWLVLAVGAMASLSGMAFAAQPAPYTARYEVLRNGEALGSATVTWRRLGDGTGELNSDTEGSMFGLIKGTVNERSVVRWTPDGPETVHYQYLQEIPFKTVKRSLEVDAGSGRIDSTDKDKRHALDYTRGVLDRNAINIALMSDVASGLTGDLSHPVANRDKVETQVYRTMDSAKLATALGSQRTIRLERIRESANGRSTTLWLGQDKAFVPLRILQKEPKGDTIEMRITSLR